MKSLISDYSIHIQEVEQILDAALPPATTVPVLLHESMRYSTLGGGKRLRALLVMASCAAVGGDVRKTTGLVGAIEMVHAYSLIHDDLPCMDDDDLRRGRPANHIAYGEAIAVLAGDALLTEAFLVLARMPERYGISPEITVRVIAELAEGAGSQGMVGGQAADISNQDGAVDEETLRYIHEHKTGALFKAALRGGALLGGASEEQLRQITSYGDHFGLAFQITDDILDEVGYTEQLGKAVRKDERLGKQTYPRLYGLEKSREMARRCVEQCCDALKSFPDQAGFLRELASFIIQRDR